MSHPFHWFLAVPEHPNPKHKHTFLIQVRRAQEADASLSPFVGHPPPSAPLSAWQTHTRDKLEADVSVNTRDRPHRCRWATVLTRCHRWLSLWLHPRWLSPNLMLLQIYVSSPPPPTPNPPASFTSPPPAPELSRPTGFPGRRHNGHFSLFTGEGVKVVHPRLANVLIKTWDDVSAPLLFQPLLLLLPIWAWSRWRFLPVTNSPPPPLPNMSMVQLKVSSC